MNIGLVTACLAVTLAFGQWEPDVQATNFPGSGKSVTAEPAASVDSFVYLVWDDSRDPSMHETYFKRSTDDGATWQDDVRLTPADAYWSPCASVAAQGPDVHVVWHELRHTSANPTNEEVYYIRSTDHGATWNPEARLTNDTSHSWHPRIAVSGSTIHVAWADYRTGLWQVWYKRSTDYGATWQDDVQLSNGTGIIEVPEVAVADLGVHVVWQDSRHGLNNHEVYYVHSTDGGATWGAETRLTSEPHESYAPVVAAAGPDVHVVWVDYRDSNSEVYYKHSTDHGNAWGPDVDISNSGSNPGLYTTLPSAASSGGNVHVVWGDNFDGNGEIYYRLSGDNGSSWGDRLRLTSESHESVTPVVMLTGDEVKVVWPDQRAAPNLELFFKRNPTGNSSAVCEPGRSRPRDLLRISPNPLRSGFVTVHPPSGAAVSRWLRVFDAAGSLVRSAAGLQASPLLLDLRSVPDGVYLVRLDSDGCSATQKLVVQR
jgi:hypothetical protein